MHSSFARIMFALCLLFTPRLIAQSAPTIAGAPSAAAVGERIAVNGNGFGATQGSSTVTLNGVPVALCPSSQWSNTYVCISIPANQPLGATALRVTTSSGSSDAFTLNIEGALVVNGVTPGSAVAGSQVTIAGANFGPSSLENRDVLYLGNGGSVGFRPTITSWSDTQIVVTLPTAATAVLSTGYFAVSAMGSTVNSPAFIIVGPPTIAGAPSAAAVGERIAVSGNGFGATQGSSTVTLNGVATALCPSSQWSNTSLCISIPASQPLGATALQVTTSFGSSAAFTVNIEGPLAVNGVTPGSAVAGSQVTIAGANFGPSSLEGRNVVYLGNGGNVGFLPTITSWTDTQIVVTLPTAATAVLSTGYFAVSAMGSTVNSPAFIIVGPPTIAGITPANGSPGTSITIAGSNFGATQGAGQVLLGQLPMTVTSWSDTSILATIPPGATTGNVTVKQGSTVSNALLFTVQSLVLNASRYQHSATLLNNGTVLIAGGINCTASGSCTYLNSAEIYDPSSRVFTSTGNLGTPRSAPAVLLQNGKVLIAGGYKCDSAGNCASLSTAEIYDPTSHTFMPAGNMTAARNGHTMTLLRNGQVLIAGGQTCAAATSCIALNTAELYDPIQGLFTSTASLSAARYNASAAVLNSGLVLIAGGFDGATYPSTAELYDPAAGTFSAASNLIFPRSNATATLLNGGRVLIAGGSTCSSPSCPAITAEVYIPGAGFNYASFTGNPGSMNFARLGHTATLLTNGQVLLAGGYDSCGSTCNSGATIENYDPVAFAFTTGTSMATARSGHTATLLGDGSVVLIGGINNGLTLSTTDSYQPASLTPNGLVSITVSPSAFPMVLGTNLPLVAIGTFADFSTQILLSVNWNSSSPSVAGITNDAGSSGIVSSQNFGSTTITASVGAVSGSSQITVTPPLVSLALSPANPSVATAAVQQLQLTATGVYSDGSSADLTPYVTWTTSDNTVAMVLPTSGTHGIVGTGNPGNVTITATFAGVSSSTSVTVTPPIVPIVPNITDVSPATAAGGTQVTVTGTGFGSSQGNGSVWLGSTLGTIVTWSNTHVVAKVATGSTTGIAQIQQAGISSNTLPFNVITPTISSVTPTSGLAGTPVTINGTGFGTAQGAGQIWLGTAPGIISSWSDTQILATVAAGSATGTVQVLQAGVVSNAVPFAVNTPSITSITPTSGIAGTSVTISGSGFGSAQGSGIAWIGSAQGVVASWADTQVVATVDSTAVSGIVRIQQNGIWSNALSFKVPPSLSTAPSVNINPNLVSMVVGETRSLQALDDGGTVLAGLTWASTDPTVATLSTDDPPIVTAIAPGHVTITAGNASADLTVYPGPALPLGTVQWSIPGDGSGVTQILPAVPSDSGIDVFAQQQSGNIQAVKTDGRVAWTSTVGTDKKLVPDFLGGLAVADSQSIRKLDGLTGQPLPAYNFVNPNGSVPPVLVHTDGTVLTVDGDTVVGIDPLTGNPKFNVQLEHTIFSTDGNCGEFTPSETAVPPDFGPPIIAGDGFAYFPYHYVESPLASNGKVCYSSQNPRDGDVLEAFFIHRTTHLRVLRVAMDGSYSKIVLGDWTFDHVDQCVYVSGPGSNFGECAHTRDVVSSSGATPDFPGVLGTLITNADQGAYYSWELGFNGASPAHQLTTISGASASTISLPVPGTLNPMLQGSDGTLFGTVSLPPDPSGQPGSSFMIALDALGNPKWTAPNLSPKYLTDNGNVITQSSSGLSVTLDSGGNTTTQVASFELHPSWTGQSYQADLLSVSSSLSSLSMLPIGVDGSFAALSGGNHSNNSTAIQQVLTTQPHGPNDQIPPSDATLHPTYHAIELLTSASPDSIFTKYILTFQGGRGTNNDVMDTLVDTQTGTITSTGQLLTFILHSVPALGQGPFTVRVNRLDPSTHTLVVVTQKGHPLDGWRYWRVFSVGTNDIVIETGAADRPHPGPLNYIGYYLANGQLKVWEEFLQFIKRDLNVPQGPHSQWNIVNGTRQFDLNYILQNMCLSCP
ncbi:MAG: IPT/TIG domain-containing protein [Candidatus Angelobacter sp.]